MNKESGFTMIELMCVVGVVGLITAISIPNMMSWREDQKLSSCTRDLLAAVHLSRLKAVKENAQVVIDFNLASDKYEAFVDNGAGGGTSGNWNREGGEVLLKKGDMPDGVNLLATNFDGSALAFDSRGSPVLTGGVLAVNAEIYLKNELRSLKGIRVSLAGNPSIINVAAVNDGY